MKPDRVYTPNPARLASHLIALLIERGPMTLAALSAATEKPRKSVCWALRPALDCDYVYRQAIEAAEGRSLVFVVRSEKPVITSRKSEATHAPVKHMVQRVVPAHLSACPVSHPHGWASVVGAHPHDYPENC